MSYILIYSRMMGTVISAQLLVLPSGYPAAGPTETLASGNILWFTASSQNHML